MFRTQLVLALALSLAGTVPAAIASDQDIDKVNGSIQAEVGQRYGNLETVNGSIRIDTGVHTGNAETVNGSIRVADNAQVGGLETVNGGIRLSDQIQAGGSLETVNGEIFVGRGGRVAGNIETVNGSIGLVDTDLAGDIETVNGDITVGSGSHVRGGITISKPNSNNWMPISIGKRRTPRIIIGPDAVVEGALVFEREVKLYVHGSARIGPVTGATAVRYDGARAPQD